MGKEYLIDSNAIIDFFNYSLPKSGIDFLLSLDPIISIITEIEIFGKVGLSESEIDKLRQFIKTAMVYDVDKVLASKTIDLRFKHKIKLPDAIIATTAIHNKLILITRNVSDFDKVEGLEILNPHSI